MLPVSILLPYFIHHAEKDLVKETGSYLNISFKTGVKLKRLKQINFYNKELSTARSLCAFEQTLTANKKTRAIVLSVTYAASLSDLPNVKILNLYKATEKPVNITYLCYIYKLLKSEY